MDDHRGMAAQFHGDAFDAPGCQFQNLFADRYRAGQLTMPLTLIAL